MSIVNWEILLLITFLASAVQATTGFGFGLITVSVFLIMLDSIAAIQIVIIVTLLMSCFYWPKMRGIAPRPILLWLSIGCVFGFPFGILMYHYLDLQIIKAAVAVIIILISLQNGWHMFRPSPSLEGEEKKSQQRPLAVLGTGLISGVMASSMAMPGPSVMLYLARTSLSVTEIRATILTFFIFSYSGSLILQTTVVGIESQTWIVAFTLLPAALLGTVAGHYLAKHIQIQIFKSLVLLILLTTGVFMLVNL